MRRWIHALAWAACLSGTAALAQEGRVILPDQGDGPITLVLPGAAGGIDPSERLQVFVGPVRACCAGRSPMAGRYTLDQGRLVFDPAFDFVDGQDYTIKTGRTLTAFALLPAQGAALPEIVAIYPSGPTIPENTLRFYIHFATPMAPHRSADFITLVDATGTPDQAAFMHFKQELWSADRTRLTLLMDPGRIKRGVAQNRTLGPALLEGARYGLVIKAGWPSATGSATLPRFEKPFTVSAPLRTLPDTALWAVHPPRALSRDALVIDFDRPFDHQLAQSGITVFDAAGNRVSGAVSVENAERRWRFVPQAAWASGLLHLTVDARLEDVAGNNFIELLDHALGTEPRSADHQSITVMLRAPGALATVQPSRTMNSEMSE